MNRKALIFDLDGVICSTDEYHYQAWKQLANALGIPFDREINNRLRGISRMESLDIILERAETNYAQEQKEQFAARKNEIYRKLLANMSGRDLNDSVRETLVELRSRGYLLAIGSSSKNTKYILNQIGLGDFFDAISDGTNIIRSKPDPEVFLKAADYLGVPPAECAIVEDAVAGVQAGKAANMKTIAVGDAAKAGVADINLESFHELLDYFP